MNLLKTRSGSEPRVVHPISLGFGWITVLTTHQNSERYGQELVIADLDIQALMQGDRMENGFGSEVYVSGVRIGIPNPTRIGLEATLSLL